MTAELARRIWQLPHGAVGVPSHRRASARQAASRSIARGERPVYRAMQSQDGRWYVLGYPWLSIDAGDHRSALEGTRAAVAEWLGVEPDASTWRRGSSGSGVVRTVRNLGNRLDCDRRAVGRDGP
jgi:hypothetical protein